MASQERKAGRATRHALEQVDLRARIRIMNKIMAEYHDMMPTTTTTVKYRPDVEKIKICPKCWKSKL